MVNYFALRFWFWIMPYIKKKKDRMVMVNSQWSLIEHVFVCVREAKAEISRAWRCSWKYVHLSWTPVNRVEAASHLFHQNTPHSCTTSSTLYRTAWPGRSSICVNTELNLTSITVKYNLKFYSQLSATVNPDHDTSKRHTLTWPQSADLCRR